MTNYRIHRRLREAREWYLDQENGEDIVSGLEIAWSEIKRDEDPVLADPWPKEVKGVTHGSWSTYINFGCRCKACTKANTEGHLSLRKHKRSRRD